MEHEHGASLAIEAIEDCRIKTRMSGPVASSTELQEGIEDQALSPMQESSITDDNWRRRDPPNYRE
jgi:hypothetical protein